MSYLTRTEHDLRSFTEELNRARDPHERAQLTLAHYERRELTQPWVGQRNGGRQVGGYYCMACNEPLSYSGEGEFCTRDTDDLHRCLGSLVYEVVNGVA